MQRDKVRRIVFYVCCFGLFLAGISTICEGNGIMYYPFFDSRVEFLGIMVTGGFASLLCILGIVSVCRQSPLVIRIFAVLSGISFVVMLTLLFMTLHFSLEDNVTELVEETWKEEQITPGSMDMIQEMFSCCGVEGSHDYTSLGRDISRSCCRGRQPTCHGCRETMYEFMRNLYARKNMAQYRACGLLFWSTAISMSIAYKLKKSEEIGFERFTS